MEIGKFRLRTVSPIFTKIGGLACFFDAHVIEKINGLSPAGFCARCFASESVPVVFVQFGCPEGARKGVREGRASYEVLIDIYLLGGI